jgi:hypothetical protein
MAVPGETPRSPFKIEAPTLVTADAPSTAKCDAVPRSMAWALVAANGST